MVILLTSGTMDVRVGLLVLFVLGANWASEARQLENPFISGKFATFVFLLFVWDRDMDIAIGMFD